MVSITFFGGIGEIGGNKILLHDGNGCRILMDFGRRMGYYNTYYGGFTKARSNSGARDLLKLGVLPKIDGIYRKCLLNGHINTLPPANTKDADIEWDAFNKAPDYWDAQAVVSYEAWRDKHDNKAFVDAILLTHAHYDHVQDISFLSEKIPIYCTRETKTLAKAISDVTNTAADVEFYYYSNPVVDIYHPLPKDLYRVYFPETPYINKDPVKVNTFFPQINRTFEVETSTPKIREFNAMPSGKPFSIGKFSITLIETDHSVPGACAYLVEIDGKKILYTGDIRFHGRGTFTLKDFCKAARAPVDVLVVEGTRVGSTVQLTEVDIEADIAKEIKAINGLVLVDFNWKDVDRFYTVWNAAVKAGRTLLILPKLAFLLFQLHVLDGKKYMDPREMKGVRVYLHRQGEMLYSRDDYKTTDGGYVENWGRNKAQKDNNLKRIKENIENNAAQPGDAAAWELATHHFKHGVRAYQVRETPEKYVLMFSYWNVNELLDLSNSSGELPQCKYIRASCEPFNDEMYVDEAKLMAWLDKFKISYDPDVTGGQTIVKRKHVSGHASKPELEDLIKNLSPKVVYPVHTEDPGAFKGMVPAGVTVVDTIIPGKEYAV